MGISLTINEIKSKANSELRWMFGCLVSVCLIPVVADVVAKFRTARALVYGDISVSFLSSHCLASWEYQMIVVGLRLSLKVSGKGWIYSIVVQWVATAMVQDV